MKPDFMVYTPEQKLLLVVTVKATNDESEQWAAKFRRNLLVNGAIPTSPYFLLVLPQHVYLWKDASTQEEPPAFVGFTKEMLQPYLGGFGENFPRLSESGLEFGVRSWLFDATTSPQGGRANGDWERLLVDSGLAHQISNGALLCGDMA